MACVYTYIGASSVPCFKEVIKSARRQELAEEEFRGLVEVVTEAVREARQSHQQTAVKVGG